ncbi:MAG: hypothetical protein MR999_09795 [Flintibacter sp.]|uniref:hypothetical protein n=1 Tax=Flintibacter sp. TaxID=1918624 RepID=UPI002D80231F|nr:hypothetical protein [Flintibacter sp.]MCI7159681.1 hypothetical protein [Flintibacter sp.]
MASNYTENYGLCQWEATDQVRREEFNQDQAKIDEALKVLADKDTALDGAIAAVAAAAGNCQMELITYTGTGTYGEGKPTQITFSILPDIFIIVGDKSIYLGRGDITNSIIASEDFINDDTCSWEGVRLSITNYVSARYQMNGKSKAYWVVGLKRKK